MNRPDAVIEEQVVVVGAGPAGLAAASALKEKGIDALIVEKGPSVATSWRSRHDHLRLNTHRVFSHQPGQRLPRALGPYPSRDGYIAYLERYAERLRIRTGTEATKIDSAPGGWKLSLREGTLRARHLVVSTGPDLQPVLPTWPGHDTFTGTVMHAGSFTNVADMRGKDILVVGPGNSGVDLLNHLVADPEVGALWLSARSGMTIVPTRLFGLPLHPVAVMARYLPVRAQDLTLRLIERIAFGDLTDWGFPKPNIGPITRVHRDNVTLAVDDGFVAALKAGRVTMRPAIDHLDGDQVHFTDGTSCRPDVVICATGYRPGLEPLVGHLTTLDHIGMPPVTGPRPWPAHPGLWFFGLNRSVYGNMHIRRREARHLARHITHALDETPPPVSDRQDTPDSSAPRRTC